MTEREPTYLTDLREHGLPKELIDALLANGVATVVELADAMRSGRLGDLFEEEHVTVARRAALFEEVGK